MWTETCAITHAPILGGDKVVMFVLTKKGVTSKWWKDPVFAGDNLEACHRNVTYDDYGWVKEVPEDEDARPDFRSIFIRQSVWDKIQTLPDEHDVRYFGWLEPDFSIKRFQPAEKLADSEIQIDKEITKLANFASSCRINLNSGIAYKGHQEFSLNRLEMLEQLMKETRLEVANRRRVE